MVVAERRTYPAPSIELVPAAVSSMTAEALELAESCGLPADPWQERVLDAMLGLDAAGGFAAFRVGMCVPRQNGKGAILEMRELAGVFLLGEMTLTHSAQQMNTSIDHMQRLVAAIEEGGLSDKIRRVYTASGAQSIWFKSGQVIRFQTRSRYGGRGLKGDLIVFDEAMFIADYMHSTLVPQLTTRERPQLVYAGSAADQTVHEHALVWARLRAEALKGEDPELAYLEWSADFRNPSEVPDEIDMAQIARSNPAFGIRVSEKYVRNEWRTLDPRGRAVERYNVGDWPNLEVQVQHVVDMARWAQLVDAESQIDGPVVFAFDVSPERSGAIAAAGLRADGRFHVEVIQARKGTSWIAGWLAERVEAHRPFEVVCDSKGPVGSVLPAVEDAGVTVRTVDVGEHADACGKFVDLIAEADLRHLGQPVLEAALRGAATRPLGDAWLWSRKSSGTDISPLVAATLAVDAAAAMPTGGIGAIF